MFKVTLAVRGAAVSLMVGTALIAVHSGPPVPTLSSSDAQMSVERLHPFVIKPQPSKLNDLTRHGITVRATATTASQTAAPADPPAIAAPTTTPAGQPDDTAAPPAAPPFLSTDLTTDHTKNTGGILNFLRSVIRGVAGFLSTAEENLWVIMIGVAGILFLTTGFWQFHAIAEERHNKNQAGGSSGSCGPSGSCKTKGPCH
jgi:hypothetical protein